MSDKDFTEDLSFPTRSINMQIRNEKYQSPLLHTPGQTRFDKEMPSTSNNTNFNGVHNRLGQKNNFRYNRDNRNNFNKNRNDKNRNNKSDNFKKPNRNDNFNTNIKDHDRNDDFNKRNGDWRTYNTPFNRKRVSDGDQDDPTGSKRRWNNNQQFYQTGKSNTNIAQTRLERIRASQTDLSIAVSNEDANDIKNEILNDLQDVDATDITIEVKNHNVQPKENLSPIRFKMILDPKTQASIKVLQAKRREKQVIFPYPVTPNVTEISLNERFAML